MNKITHCFAIIAAPGRCFFGFGRDSRDSERRAWTKFRKEYPNCDDDDAMATGHGTGTGSNTLRVRQMRAQRDAYANAWESLGI